MVISSGIFFSLLSYICIQKCLLSSVGRAFRRAERSWLYHPVFFSAFYHIFAFRSASLAQSVEQLIRNEQVVGSSPIGGSRRRVNKLKKVKKVEKVEEVEEVEDVEE